VRINESLLINTPMTPADYVLDFKLVTDSELEYRQRELQYGEEEPLATKLKIPWKKPKAISIFIFFLQCTTMTLISTQKKCGIAMLVIRRLTLSVRIVITLSEK